MANAAKVKNREVVLTIAIILAFSFLTRWGFLAQEVIDWDESTLIVVASSFANGNLPYVEIWDLKPPMYFFLVGSAMQVFGESLAVVRAFGLVSWSLVAVLVYVISRRGVGVKEATLAGILVVVAAAPYPFQPTLTEHIAVPFLILSIWLLLIGRNQFWILMLVGAMMSLATLTRTNLAFPTIAIGLYLASSIIYPRNALRRFGVFPYIVGGLIPLALVMVAYDNSGQLELFLTSNISIPLAYATEQRPAILIFGMVVIGALVASIRFPDLLGVMTVLAGTYLWKQFDFRGSGASLSRIKTLLKPSDSDAFVISIVGISTFLGMTMSGFFTWHHLLQLVPFGGLLIGPAIATNPRPWKFWIIAIAISTALVRTVPATSMVILEGTIEVASNYPLQLIANDIRNDMEDGDQVFALEGQLIYWNLRMLPPAPIAVHPSNLTRKSIETAFVESGIAEPDLFAKILETLPKYILMNSEPVWFLDNEFGLELSNALDANYSQWRAIEQYVVYRLN